jgi:hypothetical protein
MLRKFLAAHEERIEIMFLSLFKLRPAWILVIYLLIDAICIGMGMGVPIFCILFGFVAGWLLVSYLTLEIQSPPSLMRKVFWVASLMAGCTFLGMLALWGPSISWLFDPSRDLANFGIPMILYEPGASFIGWLLLMIVISPFLQLLTSLFGSYLALMRWMGKPANA